MDIDRSAVPHTAPRRHLVGVGVGPGDPELVTVKAVRALRDADVVLVPATEASADQGGRAKAIVLAACPGIESRIRCVPFSMRARHGVDQRRRAAWQRSAEEVERAFDEGAGTVAFATVGDPSVYSTFSYLADQVRSRVQAVEVSVVPGITAMQALAAAAAVPLVEGQEVLALVPMTSDPATVARALDCADTVVAYKAGRHLDALTALLGARDRLARAVLGTDIGLPGERVTTLADADGNATAPYFSTVLAPPARTHTGGRL